MADTSPQIGTTPALAPDESCLPARSSSCHATEPPLAHAVPSVQAIRRSPWALMATLGCFRMPAPATGVPARRASRPHSVRLNRSAAVFPTQRRCRLTLTPWRMWSSGRRTTPTAGGELASTLPSDRSSPTSHPGESSRRPTDREDVIDRCDRLEPPCRSIRMRRRQRRMPSPARSARRRPPMWRHKSGGTARHPVSPRHAR